METIEDYLKSPEAENFLQIFRKLNKETKNFAEKSNGNLGILCIGYMRAGDKCNTPMLAKGDDEALAHMLDTIFLYEDFQKILAKVLQRNAKTILPLFIPEYSDELELKLQFLRHKLEEK